MKEDQNIHIEILKNMDFRINIKSKIITTFQQLHHSHNQHIFVMPTFHSKSQKSGIKYSYDSKSSTLSIKIQKNRLKQHNNIVDVAEKLYKQWKSMMNKIKQLLKNPLFSQNIRLESVDALGLQFSCIFQELKNNKIYFKYSELQWNNQLLNLQQSQDLYPIIKHSLTRNFDQSPRLSFLEGNFQKYDLSSLITNVQKHFVIGHMLHIIHLYPTLLKQQEHFECIQQTDASNNMLMQQVARKRKVFFIKVFKHSYLNYLNMNQKNNMVHKITLEDHYERDQCEIIISVVTQNNSKAVKISIRRGAVVDTILKQFHQMITAYISGITLKSSSDFRQVSIQFSYQNKLQLQYVILSIEIVWFQAIDRQLSLWYQSDKISTREELSIQYIGSNRYQIYAGTFLLRFLVTGAQNYKVEIIRTDYERYKIKDKSYHFLSENDQLKIAQKLKSENQKTRTIYEAFPGLKRYVNYFLNTWNICEFYDVTTLIRFCARFEMSDNYKLVLNKILDRANKVNEKEDYFVRLNIGHQDSLNIFVVPQDSLSLIQKNKLFRVSILEQISSIKVEVSSKEMSQIVISPLKIEQLKNFDCFF